MNRHLGERALLRALEGESRAREREHLASCATCVGRRAQLARDLRRIGTELREGRAPRMIARPSAIRWMPAVLGASAAAGLLVWGVLGRSPIPAEVADAEPLSLDNVTAALFATDEIDEVARPVRGSEFVEVQAALRGEWPCASPDPWFDRDCS
jgi:hypothetical protein